ncbi:MAG: hypothetical protein Salg2KO_08680 [Salibacteraceae bacterium]
MKYFDDIIKEKLSAVQTDAPSTTWNKIEQGLPKPSSTSFQGPLIAGIAASAALGILFTALPDINDHKPITPHIVAEDHAPEFLDAPEPNEENILFEEIEPQTVHAIVLNKTKAIENPDSEHNPMVEMAVNEVNNANTHQPEDSPIDSPLPNVDFVAEGIQCINSDIRFEANTNHLAAEITWLFDGLTVLEGKQVSFKFEEHGIHSIRMSALFENGQKAVVTSEIEVYDSPSTAFYKEFDESTDCFNQTISLQGLERSQAYKWLLDGDTVGKGNTLALSIKSGLHTLAVHTINEAGCMAFEETPIRVEPAFKLNVPTAFTPINSDGLNDQWTVSGLNDVESFTVRITRASDGRVAFESSERIEWDGSIAGTPERAKRGEIFSYLILAVDKCGESTKLTGSITCL